MSKFFSFSLYYISFLPLWLSILFVDVKNCVENRNNLWTEKIGIICVIVFLCLCLGNVFVELHITTKKYTVPVTLKQAKEEKSLTTEYLLSYILPLFAFDFTVWSGIILFLIFFSTLGILCIKHNYVSVNIVVELLDFRFYNCILENEDGVEFDQMIISHRKLTGCIGDKIYLKSLNNEYKMDIKR